MRYSTEILALRLFQVLLFFMSYVFARTLLDVHDWEHNFYFTALYCMLFVLIFAIFGHLLPKEVPRFLAIMALPPYIDGQNLAIFRDVLLKGRDREELGVRAQRSDDSHRAPAAPTLLGAAQHLEGAHMGRVTSTASIGDSSDLRKQVARLHDRLASLEASLAADGPKATATEDPDVYVEEAEQRSL